MSDRIRHAVARLTPQPLGHIDYEGIRHQALPLFGTIGQVWLLRPDGSLWRADSDFGLALEPLPRDLHVVALVEGAKRYPWLAELLPTRPDEAIQCPECGGHGRLGGGKGPFCLTCNALGWVLASENATEKLERKRRP